MFVYSTWTGIDTGSDANKRNPDASSIDMYATTIGYTSLGMITGLTYPISYPLFGCYLSTFKKAPLEKVQPKHL
jgi:hypothetical protein